MNCRNHPGDSGSTLARARLLSAGVLAPVAAVALFAAAPLRAGLDVPSLGDPTSGRLVGRVNAGKAPLPAAQVYVYDVADSSKLRTTTDRFGRYAFQPLSAGIYRVIAHRPGYVPAVVELTRTTSESVQSLDFELGARGHRSGKGGEEDEEDFWSVRARIPSDVLRQIQIAEAIADDQGWALETAIQRERFEAELRTLSGIEEAGGAGARVLGSQLDLRSQFGETQLALRSDLREFKRQAFRTDTAQQPLGDSHAFALNVNRRGSNIQFTSQRHRFQGAQAGALDDWDSAAGAGLESYGVRLEQAAGGGASHFEARYNRGQQTSITASAISTPAPAGYTARRWPRSIHRCRRPPWSFAAPTSGRSPPPRRLRPASATANGRPTATAGFPVGARIPTSASTSSVRATGRSSPPSSSSTGCSAP